MDQASVLPSVGHKLTPHQLEEFIQASENSLIFYIDLLFWWRLLNAIFPLRNAKFFQVVGQLNIDDPTTIVEIFLPNELGRMCPIYRGVPVGL